MALLIEQREDMTGNRMRERGKGERHKTGTRTRVYCSEDKASVHGTPALRTELNDALPQWFLRQTDSAVAV